MSDTPTPEKATTPEFLEGLIDLPRVRAEIDQLTAEINDLEQQRRAVEIMIENRITKRERLLVFFAMVAVYRMPLSTKLAEIAAANAGAPAAEVATGNGVAAPATPVAAAPAPVRPSNKTLVRDPAKTQTKIAKDLLRIFGDGNEFDLNDAVSRLRHFVPDEKTPGQWIGGYLTRESTCTNGIVDCLGPRRYRMRSDAENILEKSISTTAH